MSTISVIDSGIPELGGVGLVVGGGTAEDDPSATECRGPEGASDVFEVGRYTGSFANGCLGAGGVTRVGLFAVSCDKEGTLPSAWACCACASLAGGWCVTVGGLCKGGVHAPAPAADICTL